MGAEKYLPGFGSLDVATTPNQVAGQGVSAL